MDKCFLCNASLENAKAVTVNRGIDTLIKASIDRGDNLQDALQQTRPLRVHEQCRKNYIRPSSIQASTKCSGVASKFNPTRSSVPAFDFRRSCIICGNAADEIKEKKLPQKYRRLTCEVSTLEIINNLNSVAESRNDDWGRDIKTRISGVINLVAAEGRYHKDCYAKFLQVPCGSNDSSAEPQLSTKEKAFLKLCIEIDQGEECQYTHSDIEDRLSAILDGECGYTTKHLKQKLLNHYGNNIIISSLHGRSPIICFRESDDKIIKKQWYEERKSDKSEERLRIVKAAAAIIKAEIRSQAYDLTTYSADGRDIGKKDIVPQNLQCFVNILIESKTNSQNALRKRQSISEALISACRPRSFVSPILLGLGVYIHRHYASCMVIDILSSLGFCVPYTEVQKLEHSLKATPMKQTLGAFIQFAFNNADFNVRTIDGNNTFHNMGGIKITTPKDESTEELRADRNLNDETNIEMNGRMQILTYQKPPRKGLTHVNIRDVDLLQNRKLTKQSVLMDYLWLTGYWLNSSPVPNWNGYMQLGLQSESEYNISDVTVLPFINLDPGNLSCIYSALKYARSECDKIKQTTCFVTFDQPLYAKATDIVASSSGDDLNDMVVFLGGFYTIKSFLGSIGHIITRSGIEELWSTTYAKNAVGHMISGHAYSRAMRAHNLTQIALSSLILENNNEFNEDEKQMLLEIYHQFERGQISEIELRQSSIVIKAENLFSDTLESTEDSSRTARLWIQYIRLVNVLHCYLRAERTGNFELHFQSIREMIPFFHASGHLAYAKWARFHLQQIEDLKEKIPCDEYEKFASKGYFTIWRSDRFWSGVSADLAIEQGLMRSMKTKRGLTTGRAITDSTLSTWIAALPSCVKMCECIEEFSGVKSETTEQHVDLRDNRQTRDHRDIHTFREWLVNHNPFTSRPKLELISFSNGLLGDDSINCDRALEIGKESMDKLSGVNFGEAHLKRKDKVNSLSNMNRSIVVRNARVDVNPQQLFNSIVCVMNSEECQKEAFKYELAPKPPCLFDEVSFRKTNKSELSKKLESFLPYTSPLKTDTSYVLDGGYLQHAVAWPSRPTTYNEVCESYASYVHRNYGATCITVSDGYRGEMSTKVE